jgi:hypothetical protein
MHIRGLSSTRVHERAEELAAHRSLLAGAEARLVMALAVVAVCALALFAAGALMSIAKTPTAAPLPIHRVAPFLIAAGAIACYLLLRGRA